MIRFTGNAFIPNICSYRPPSLLHQLRQDEARHGHINVSMLRIVWLLCRSRLLIVSLLHMTVAAGWILITMLCLGAMMDTSNNIWSVRDSLKDIQMDDEVANSTVAGHNSTADLHVQLANHNRANIEYTAVYVLVVVALVGVRTAANALALRTAIMLRNACAGAAFQATVSSSVQSRVASHQVRVCNASECLGVMCNVRFFYNLGDSFLI